MLVAQDDRRVYTARENSTFQIIAFLGGGILFLVPIFFLFIVNLGKPSTKSDSFQPGMIGGMSVIPIMLIARGLFLLRSTNRVIIDEKGISLEGPMFFKAIPWNTIERMRKTERSQIMGGNYDVLELTGAKGKKLAEIPDTVDRFPGLVEQITDRSTTARGAPTTNPAEDEAVELKKTRRKLRLLGATLAVFALLFGAGTWFSLNESIQDKKFATESVQTNGWVVRLNLPQVEYQFADEQGHQHKRTVTMQGDVGAMLLSGEPLAIEYLRSDPSRSRPVKGEQRVEFSIGWPIFLIAAIAMAGLGIATLMGYEIKTKGGVTQITRWGKPRDED